MATEGEQAESRVPAPAALRPVLAFSRLSAAAYATIARVVDDDGIFRARVAEQADEDEVGRVGWLWLHRPVGWADDPAITGEARPAASEGASSKAARRAEKEASAKHRRAAADAEAARKRTADQLAAVRRDEAAARAERDRLAAKVAVLQDERNAALRSAKALEAELATARRDLRVARAATRQAEEELLARPAGPAEDPAAHPRHLEAGRSVRAAAQAAAELAASLAAAADVLAPVPAAPPPHPGGSKGKGKGRRRSTARTNPTLPPGVFDGTPEAHRHLIGSGANLVVVDGYNVSRAAWSGLVPEEERRRTVSLLDDVQARSGAVVVVVFDGDDAVTAPTASKNVRVRFSATGQTADDAIADLLEATSPSQPVVVISSDRAVAADARRLGAVPIGAKAFLRAAGR